MTEVWVPTVTRPAGTPISIENVRRAATMGLVYGRRGVGRSVIPVPHRRMVRVAAA